MQDAIYKPCHINDEVFLILIAQEQPYKPVLFKCIVKNIVRVSVTATYYHVMPIELLTSVTDQLTIRCVSKYHQIKDITVDYDKASKLNWCQQFATFNDNWFIDAQQHAIYATLQQAIIVIHNLNNKLMQELYTVIADLSTQNNELQTLAHGN
jgi:hypothetical protein